MGLLVFSFVRANGDVVSESYHKLLAEDVVIPELENQGHLKKAVFQQEGVKPLTADVILMLLRKTFKKMWDFKLLFHLFNCGWLCLPPYGPDLNPCDYFLWVTSRTEFIEIIRQWSTN